MCFNLVCFPFILLSSQRKSRRNYLKSLEAIRGTWQQHAQEHPSCHTVAMLRWFWDGWTSLLSLFFWWNQWNQRVFSGEGHPGMEWNTSPSEAVVSVYFSFLGKINWPLFGDKKKTHCKNKKYQKIMLKSHFFPPFSHTSEQ